MVRGFRKGRDGRKVEWKRAGQVQRDLNVRKIKSGFDAATKKKK